MRADDTEGWGWTPADDDEKPLTHTDRELIGQWVDHSITAASENAQPYDVLGQSEIGRRLLHRAQLAVTARCGDDVDEARYWLAGLGLIPDPFEAAPNNRGPWGRISSHRRKEE